jgi:molybdate transport system substrate-binding protein
VASRRYHDTNRITMATFTRRASVVYLSMALMCFGNPVQGAEASQRDMLVFAAASLSDVLTEIGVEYRAHTGQQVKFSFAASSILARQIEVGATAEVFFSADVEWMDYLQSRKLLDASSRQNIVGNRLALIAPSDSRVELKIAPRFELLKALGRGRLATGDPDGVPAGRYARAALLSLGVWNDVEDRLVRADNVRTAVAFVARGEVPLGIVYETDARIEKRVRIVDIFPESTHPPILYPAAAIVDSRPAAREFVAFLQSSKAQEIFQKYGFRVLEQH